MCVVSQRWLWSWLWRWDLLAWATLNWASLFTRSLRNTCSFVQSLQEHPRFTCCDQLDLGMPSFWTSWGCSHSVTGETRVEHSLLSPTEAAPQWLVPTLWLVGNDLADGWKLPTRIHVHSNTDAQTCATEHSGNDLIQNVSMLLIQDITWPVSDM